jgi:hypothetical protein
MISATQSPQFIVRRLRSNPYLYSMISKVRLFHSRYLAGAHDRKKYKDVQSFFSMSVLEEKHYEDLIHGGFTVLPEFFKADFVDYIYARADRLFRSLEIDLHDAYSVQKKKRASLAGMSYQELEASEKMITLKDPLLSIPECVDIAFNESILKIVTNFLGYIAPWYKVMLLRDFPSERPREASNFHRDNDEADSVQVFTYLVDIDERRGPLIYVPGTNRYDTKSCRPRLSRDLGIDSDDGRISDQELEKYYPKETWRAVKVKRGSVAIIHGNGFHKGPAWPMYGDPTNQPRTAVRLDFHGHKIGMNMRWKANKIRRKDFTRLNALQKLFVDDTAIAD